MSQQPDRLALQPKQFPIDRVKIDFRELLSSLGQAFTHGTLAVVEPTTSMASGANAVAAVFGAAEAFESDAPVEVRAWHLVRSALAAALAPMLEELSQSRREPPRGDLKHLDSRFDLILEGEDAFIDKNFLENPRSLKLLGPIGRALEGWLTSKLDLNAGEAHSFADRIAGRLGPALRDESRKHFRYYEPVYQWLNDPFTPAAQMEWDWEKNRLNLIGQMDNPVFEETFSLRQIYVPLRGYVLEGQDRRCRVVILAEEIDYWLKEGPALGDAIRLLTGGPGSGKSTFAKWLAAELSSTGRMRVLFIPLQRFRIQADLRDAIADYLTRTTRFGASPLAQSEFATPANPLLLIFDGLDELSKPGDLADEQTALFINELRQHLTWWNEHGVRVMALITGRTVYAESKRPLLRIQDRQEVAVLPYLVEETKRQELESRGSLSGASLLKNDQRRDWWTRYAVAKGLSDTAFPDSFMANRDLRELSADPLLNYLVVLCEFHTELDEDEDVNRNRIYGRLLKDVLDRRHAKRSQADHVALAAVDDAEDRDRFERVLETIALAAWRGGDGRTTSRAEIENLLPTDLKAMWEGLVNSRLGFSRLVAAFYFRQADTSPSSEAIEFTHKSFCEFLAARRLTKEIGRICIGRDQSHQYYSESLALLEWASLTYRQSISLEIQHFLRDEVALRSNVETQLWVTVLRDLFALQLRVGFPIEAFSTRKFRAVESQARNAEEALAIALDACNRVVGGEIGWEASDFVGFIQRMHIDKGVFDPIPGLKSLRRTNLGGAYLMGLNLRQADLRYSDLRGAHLSGANLSDADLSGCSLAYATIGGISSYVSNIATTVFGPATISGADLAAADLQEAQLAYLRFNEVNVEEADFSGANLRHADLRRVKNLTSLQVESAKDILGASLPAHLKGLRRAADDGERF